MINALSRINCSGLLTSSCDRLSSAPASLVIGYFLSSRKRIERLQSPPIDAQQITEHSFRLNTTPCLCSPHDRCVSRSWSSPRIMPLGTQEVHVCLFGEMYTRVIDEASSTVEESSLEAVLRQVRRAERTNEYAGLEVVRHDYRRYGR